MIEYKIGLKQANKHLVSLSMEFEAPCNNPIIELPSWTPGSYLIRDYSRHIQNLKLTSHDDSLNKITKNQWMIPVSKDSKVNLEYELYCFEFSVRTNYLDNRYGLINGAATFFYLKNLDGLDYKSQEYTISFDLDGFETFSSLPHVKGKYFAEDYDELVDSPVAIVKPEYYSISEYMKEDIKNRVLVIGEEGNYDIQSISKDLKAIQSSTIKLFGELPYNRYLWILFVVQSGGGGLEHKFSNVSIFNRWKFRERENYIKFLTLESHEHFHVFNVKRIRPKQLGPFNYESETYTTALWIAEGLTNFYEKQLIHNEGLIDANEYLSLLEKAINSYLKTPGRFVRSLTLSSFDAWIKLYKPDENSINSVVSYYLKGGLVGFLLNLEILTESKYKSSLDDVYRYLYTEYKKDPTMGFDEKSFDSIVQNATGVNVTEFFNKFIYSTTELPFDKYFERIGVEIKKNEILSENLFGVKLNSANKIKEISADSDLYGTEISVNDEIISINGSKISGQIMKEINSKIPTDVKIGYFKDEMLYFSNISLVSKEFEFKLSFMGTPSESQLNLRSMIFNDNLTS